MIAPASPLGCEQVQGPPQFARPIFAEVKWEFETFRHDADNRVLRAVDQDAASDDVATSPKTTLPQAVAQHDLICDLRRVCRRREGLAQNGRDPKRYEQIRRYLRGYDAFRLPVVREVGCATAIYGDANEGVSFGGVIAHLWSGKPGG